jgi:ribosomal protein S27AE
MKKSDEQGEPWEVQNKGLSTREWTSLRLALKLLMSQRPGAFLVLTRRLCPDCGELVYYDDYFAAYICHDCGWRENLVDHLRRLINGALSTAGP